MNTTTIARPRRLRIASGAVLIQNSGYETWHTRASATPGLNDVERKVLDAIRDWYRRLYVEEFAGSLSFQRLAQRLDTDSVNVRWAVNRLVELGLIGVVRGAGARANHYLPALPRSVAARLAGAVVDEAAPPF